MCGIIGYVGHRPAVPLLLEGLKRLEYRGYDSSGLAVRENGVILCRRAVGKIQALEERLNGGNGRARVGIAHTRWATHGKPTEENAHPHADCGSRIFVVHNGIIENYQELKSVLQKRGHTFRSETDTEVLAHLIEEGYRGQLLEAVTGALRRVVGTFGVAVLSQDHPDQIIVARRGSPLVLGVDSRESFAASDVSALVAHTRRVIYLLDDDVAVLTAGGHFITNLQAGQIDRQPETVEWDVGAAQKGGFPHFMLKEIHEQPEVVTNALRGRLLESEGISKLGGLEGVQDRLDRMDRLMIVSCGTSYYAGLFARYLIESCTDVAVEVDLASEFRYRTLHLREGTVVLVISQSGETADTLAALRQARRQGVLTLGLVNVVGSSISRETDAGVYNHAGPEIGVASTKAFTSQITILCLIALLLARRRGMSAREGSEFVRQLKAIPEKIRRILGRSSEIEEIARRYARYHNFLYIGRKFNFPIAMEGALKLKEISYLHAEAYAAGEMKHGPIALIDEEFPSVCLAPRDSSYGKMVSNIQEIKARNGKIIGVGTEGDRELAELCDDVLWIPSCPETLSPLLTVVPLQLLAYYIARELGCDIDQPRNLAKSVTVE